MLLPSMDLPLDSSSSLIVNKSNRAWLGCSFSPSPALITGTLEASENSWTEFFSGCLMTIKSL